MKSIISVMASLIHSVQEQRINEYRIVTVEKIGKDYYVIVKGGQLGFSPSRTEIKGENYAHAVDVYKARVNTFIKQGFKDTDIAVIMSSPAELYFG